MATKQRRAPARKAATAANPAAAAWPFPTTSTQVVVDDASAGDGDGESLATIWPQPPGGPIGDRVEVASLRLYTDPAQNQVERIALEQLLESPFNPRTRYDEKALQELADTIRGVGVMEPILVRPVAIPGAAITRGDEVLQAYEIVFGHRRSRAAKLAGEADVPAIVRELTDAQAAQLQAIENVQRKDLDPIEEAHGYAHYLRVHGVSKEQLAAEIGLSRSHVYGRLKLATAAPEVLDALRAGELYEENALRIARLPTHKLQLKALETIRKDYRYDGDDGGKKSVRGIQNFLAEKFTLKLSTAFFDTKDAQLLPHVGDCTACSKRTGNAPEFEDLATDTDKEGYGSRQLRHGPDLCTDPDCFEAKKKRHLEIEAGKLEAKGKTVVAGAKARAAVGADGTVKGAYIALKDVRGELSKAKKGGKAAEVQTVTIQDPRTGKTIEAVAREALKGLGVKAKEPQRSGGYDYKAEQAKREAEWKKREEEATRQTKFHVALLSAVRDAAAGRALSTLAMQLIAAAALEGVEYEQRAMLAKLHDCKTFDALEKKVGQMPPERLTTLLLDCALVRNVVTRDPRYKPEPLLAAAKHYGVDVAQVRKDIEGKVDDTKTEDLLKGADRHEVDEEEEAAA